jgi:hypothetical protein
MEVSRQDALWRYRLGSAARRRTLPRERFSPLTLTGLHAVLGTGAEYKKQSTLGIPLSGEKGRDVHFTQTVTSDFVTLCCRNGPRIIPGSSSGTRLSTDAG